MLSKKSGESVCSPQKRKEGRRMWEERVLSFHFWMDSSKFERIEYEEFMELFRDTIPFSVGMQESRNRFRREYLLFHVLGRPEDDDPMRGYFSRLLPFVRITVRGSVDVDYDEYKGFGSALKLGDILGMLSLPGEAIIVAERGYIVRSFWGEEESTFYTYAKIGEGK
jgi:hypothetical protein